MTTQQTGGGELLTELGFYTLAGHSATPRDLVGEVRQAERLGIGAAFISERFSTKDAATLSGAAGAVSETIGIATGATNHNTRHPIVTATMATTMHRLTGGRFALGLGRGFDRLFRGLGLDPVTGAQLEDFVGLMRRLWHGETVLGHAGPAGSYPYLHQDATFDEDVPVLLAALGPRSLELAGRCMDGVVLHTFYSDEAVRDALASIAKGAVDAGRDPASIRVWSVLATVSDEIPADLRLLKTVGRLAAYLQGYGDLMVRVNGWDPEVLARFRADPFVKGFRGSLDGHATTDQLEHVATLIPPDWLATSATGSPRQCAEAIVGQFDLGVTGVIMHGATPAELTSVLDAYRQIRPAAVRGLPANPGRLA
ncbi:TIGR03857 family LLM class F420-dependent oxidoreductase [Frankia sp. AgB1.9]|uniref:TIGR03857 family LLM class F420-dependent oxidoreductase n=1 Tax=unclassified Frankia TaxID=2632575 RepID=UPI001932C494|nr:MULTISPECIES: TIGR03857 family LLM class F420-dependent oxidoreductase [unclassified Frankia]MBL7491166.1 TIGR03857 family LLM class F420-dependent oxidoreductase [Frankia sp. AgW1.1]MBL7548764.1 TIGR03857 family LLM class F420-dependent oxidoreductase [Frankia sp. AgB1.9]MBL7623904.1 TIGR03857 family LLM class F420-dependent oxidoreductase [Frankia sp. AgB1.8]